MGMDEAEMGTFDEFLGMLLKERQEREELKKNCKVFSARIIELESYIKKIKKDSVEVNE